jgi:hypothetical protein
MKDGHLDIDLWKAFLADLTDDELAQILQATALEAEGRKVQTVE